MGPSSPRARLTPLAQRGAGNPSIGLLVAASAITAALAAALLAPVQASARATDNPAPTSFAGDIPNPEGTMAGTPRADVLRGIPARSRGGRFADL